jgi:hypothetical protein
MRNLVVFRTTVNSELAKLHQFHLQIIFIIILNKTKQEVSKPFFYLISFAWETK